MKLATLTAITRNLDEACVRYLVVGGVAVNAHGYQRLTQDLDLVVQLNTENLLAALHALEQLGYHPALPVRIEEFADPETRRSWIEHKNMQVFPMVSERCPDTTIDLFVTEPFDFDTEYERALRTELAPGASLRFLRLRALIAMKDAAGRPRDLDDAEHLRWILEELNREGSYSE